MLRLAWCRQLLAGGCGTSRRGFICAKAGGACSSARLWSREEGSAQRGAESQGIQHQAVECPAPHHPILCFLGQLPGPQSLSRALKSHFQAVPITTNSLLCFIDKPSHFQASVLPQTEAGSCSAGIGIFRDEHTSSPRWGVNCWCLQGCFITPLVCTLWKSESKILGSHHQPSRHLTAESHVWGPPRDRELIPFLHTLLSPAWC